MIESEGICRKLVVLPVFGFLLVQSGYAQSVHRKEDVAVGILIPKTEPNKKLLRGYGSLLWNLTFSV
jgi:hypothetical protein